MEPPRRRLLRLLVILVLGGIGIGACLAALVPGVEHIAAGSQYTGKVGPMLKKLDEPTIVYDKNGDYLDTLGLKDRRPVELSEVPQPLIQAVIATEDRTFYDNPGVDLQSMVRAFLENVNKGGVEQGGSTITQQLIKNRVFKDPKRDLDRKIKEAALALRLNDEWSKNRILQEYLNTVYFGSGSYGVKAAAERFFNNTPLDKIDLAQAALLAGLIKNPEGDNPFRHPERAIARRSQVLNQMVSAHDITKEQMMVASVEPLPTVAPPTEFRPDNYYVAQVRDLLTSDARFGLGGTDAERGAKLNLGGLRVYTAYDPRTELLGQASIDQTLPNGNVKAAMAAIDPHNGDVKAIVAGPNVTFNDSQFNLATMPLDTGPDPKPTGRQPGSTFKAIVLATALENGFSVKDSIDGTSPCTLRINGLKFDPLRRTQNAEGGGGVMSLRSATENSVNCAYFRLGAAVGLPKVVEMAKRLGVTHPINPANFSLSIGSADGVSPLDMASVFATFAADGVHHDPVFIKKVVDSEGKVIFEDKGEGQRVIDPQIARTVTDVLRGVITKGTGTRAQLPDRRVAAGKTGTTDRKSDAWFVGYTPQLVAAVWMGNPLEQKPMGRVGQFGEVFGGTYPALVWKKFMTLALAGQPQEPFIPPDPKLWPRGVFVSENGRGKTATGSGRTSPTTRPLPFGGFPAPNPVPGTTPTTTPAVTTPTTAPHPPGP
ncbi:MAG: transglycosylase domain-containing protein [Acidimicrobiia bacterium]